MPRVHWTVDIHGFNTDAPGTINIDAVQSKITKYINVNNRAIQLHNAVWHTSIWFYPLPEGSETGGWGGGAKRDCQPVKRDWRLGRRSQTRLSASQESLSQQDTVA